MRLSPLALPKKSMDDEIHHVCPVTMPVHWEIDEDLIRSFCNLEIAYPDSPLESDFGQARAVSTSLSANTIQYR